MAGPAVAVPSPGASNPQYSVFEHAPSGMRWRERLWILNGDRSIARWEYFENDVLMRYTEVTTHQFNRALGEADLSYETSPLARYSLMNSPGVFIAALLHLLNLALACRSRPMGKYPRRMNFYRRKFWACPMKKKAFRSGRCSP